MSWFRFLNVQRIVIIVKKSPVTYSLVIVIEPEIEMNDHELLPEVPFETYF